MKDVLTFIKLVIIASIALALLFAGYTFYDAYKSRRIFVPPPPMTERERQLAEFDKTLRFAFKWSLLALVAVSGFGAAQRFLLVPAAKAREEVHADPQTGLYPVVVKDVTRLGQRLRYGERESMTINPNQLVGGMTSTRMNGVTEAKMLIDSNTSAGEMVSLAMATKDIQREAARYGNNPKRGGGMTKAEADFMAGVPQAKVRDIEAKARLNEHKLEQRQVKMLSEPEAKVVHEPISLMRAIAMSSANDWVIGQSTEQQPRPQDEIGTLLHYRPKNGHIAILGASGGGKTESTGFLVALYARTFGYHTIVFDGKGGVDWGMFDGSIERYDMNYENLATLWGALYNVFIERWEFMKSRGVNHIDRLDPHERMAPVFVMAEEFGESWVKLKKRDSEGYAKVEDMIDDLFRLCRATGITICLMDQAPQAWSQQMRGNTKFATIYKISGKAAGAFDEHYLNDLPDVGMFSRGNVFYRAWHTANDIDMHSMLPPQNGRILTFDSANGGMNGVGTETVLGTTPGTAGNGGSPVVETVGTAKRGGTPKPPKSQNGVPPASAVRAFQQSRRWDRFTEAVFVKEPDTTQAELRQMMARVDPQNRTPDTFKSEAFRQYHRFSPDGNRYKADRSNE